VEEILESLKAAGLTYEKDGALWYKATEHGGEKDEVLIRQNDSATYFCADIAYHYNKFITRGFSRVINVWGADHHGHVARLKGAMDAVGADGSKLEIVLMQMVRLLKDGEPYRMSKRTGRSVTLKDLLELVPVDAARFFFNLSSPRTALDFDLDLAAKQSSENPVYYVQYAHARICSILRKLEEKGVAPREPKADELLLLNAPDEIELIRLLARLPEQIVGAAQSYDPARLTRYVLDVATQFHKFYTNHHVAGEDESLTQARLCLCSATKTVIANTLGLLKISAPESM
jgi:arginyl-tRNA synthetase